MKRGAAGPFDFAVFDRRPIVVAIAGPNGAGKTTFYHSHLRRCGLRFVNPDDLGRELEIDAYSAARLADNVRQTLVQQRESFIFETVFSDPAGDKLRFLQSASASGYSVALCFIGIGSPEISEQRVSMRISQGGHDVPLEKIIARFPRTMRNFKNAVRVLPLALAFDNDDLRRPFRHVATYEQGRRTFSKPPLPFWLP